MFPLDGEELIVISGEQDIKLVPIKSINLSTCLGTGAYGSGISSSVFFDIYFYHCSVYLGTVINKHVAVKVLHADAGKLTLELKICQYLQSPHLV